MKKDHNDKLRSILEEIKSKTVTKGNITEYRDVHKIWELGLLIQEIIGDSKNPNELKKKIVRNHDWKILGKPKSESDYAYDWVTNFEDKDYFLKICKYAGFREGNKNRFRKRDLRYLVGIYSKLTKSTLTDAKRKKLETIIGNDSVLELSAEKFHEILRDAKGSDNIHWEKIIESIDELHTQICPIIESLDKKDQRDEFRNEIGVTLISQLSAAMEICMISNQESYKSAMGVTKKLFGKKSNSKNEQFQELFNNLHTLLKDYEKKDKLLSKLKSVITPFEFEQLYSYLDALQDESEFVSYFKRKAHLKTTSIL